MNVLFRILPLTIMAAMILYGCDSPPAVTVKTEVDTTGSFDFDAARKTVLEKTVRFTEAHITHDLEYLNSCFTKDARIFPPNSDIVAGYDAIAALNIEWVNYGVYEFTETSTAFYGCEEFLVDEGRYHLVYGPDSTVDKGKYINIWKPEDGEWKLQSNIWNTSLPAGETE